MYDSTILDLFLDPLAEHSGLMIDLYYCGTPNGLKMAVFFQETGLLHRIIPVDLGKGEQYKPAFLKISPNNKIPAMIDHDPVDGGEPVALFESGAMLLYLADKIGRFLPRDLRGRNEVIKWLFWQVGGLGPMAGQIGHFNVHAREKVPYAIDRYTRETRRLYKVLDTRLAGRDFIASDYSIADIACYPWIVPHKAQGQTLADFPHLNRWFETIARRPAVLRAYRGTSESYSRKRKMSDEERRVLFGTAQAAS